MIYLTAGELGPCQAVGVLWIQTTVLMVSNRRDNSTDVRCLRRGSEGHNMERIKKDKGGVLG